MANGIDRVACHCGAVRFVTSCAPEEVVDCDCTICRRYGALWAYYSPKEVQVTKDATDIYMWGARILKFIAASDAAALPDWEAVDKTHDRIGVNLRLISCRRSWRMRACATSTAQIVGNTSTNDAVEQQRRRCFKLGH